MRSSGHATNDRCRRTSDRYATGHVHDAHAVAGASMSLAMRGSVMGMAWPTMTMVHVTTPAVTVSPMMHVATTAMTVTTAMTSAAMLCEGLRWQHQCSENS